MMRHCARNLPRTRRLRLRANPIRETTSRQRSTHSRNCLPNDSIKWWKPPRSRRRDLLRGPCLCPPYEQGKNAVAILGLDAIRLSNWDRQSPVKHASDSLATMEARLRATSKGKQDFVFLAEEGAYWWSPGG